MVKFLFKIDNKEIPFETLPPGAVREEFNKLKSMIAGQLQALKCEKHHNEPTVILQAAGNKVILAGVGACCPEFLSTVNSHIKVPEPYMNADAIFTTRTLKYTHREK